MVVGYTHASNVIPLVNCSEAALLMVTSALVPLKLKALPYLPDAVQVAPLIVPLLPLPDTSVTIAPLPSLNPYAATKPGLGVGRSEEHTSELQSQSNLVCRLLLEKKKSNAPEQEWCDRRLLARIHRLTIDRLRAEIQPVSSQDFYRFLFAWQRTDAEHRVEGTEGLQAVLEQLDGCELPLASWESAVLSARVAEYDPEWLDRLCFSGRGGWRRLSTPQNSKAPAFAPLRTSPIALYQRENLQD